MKFDLKWQRHLHFALNPKSVMIDGGSIYITERVKKLSKIDSVSGETVWSNKITDGYGFLTTANGKLFYMSSGDGLCSFAKDTGELLSQQKFRFPYFGYVKVCGNIILTGGWRGYTDLCAYDLKTNKLIWSHNMKTGELQKFSYPSFLDKNRIVTVNHSTNLIKLIDGQSGKTLNENTLPEGIRHVDTGHSYRVVANDITFLAKRGELFKFNTKDLSQSVEILPLKSVQPNTPCYFDDEIILRDTKETYCLWNRVEKRIVWRTPIEHNGWTDVIATKLSNEHYIIAGAQGAVKLVSRSGEVSRMNSEKRVTTPLYLSDGCLYFGTKSEIKCFKYKT